MNTMQNETSGNRLEQLKSLVDFEMTNEIIGSWYDPVITPQAVQKWTDGKIPDKRINRIIEKTGVSRVWLQLGEGEPFQSPAVIPEQQHVEVFDDKRDYGEGRSRIPRYDLKLSAGDGNAVWIVREDDDEPLLFRAQWFKARSLTPSTLKGLYVRGDSMEPYLYDWDTVIIDTSDTEIVDGDVYAIVYKNKSYVKELRNFADGVRIISKNTNYDTMEARADELKDNSDFQVLGRVVWRGG